MKLKFTAHFVIGVSMDGDMVAPPLAALYRWLQNILIRHYNEKMRWASLEFTLSLSLTNTQTHTQTHTRTGVSFAATETWCDCGGNCVATRWEFICCRAAAVCVWVVWGFQRIPFNHKLLSTGPTLQHTYTSTHTQWGPGVPSGLQCNKCGRWTSTAARFSFWETTSATVSQIKNTPGEQVGGVKKAEPKRAAA